MIISGGQTGADRAALDAAQALGFRIGGFCPKGRRAEDGIIPPKYPLWETSSYDYAVRTRKNVQFAAATLICFRAEMDSGTQLTHQYCREGNKACFLFDFHKRPEPNELLSWVQAHRKILNVAGPRESNQPGIYHDVYQLLTETLQRLR